MLPLALRAAASLRAAALGAGSVALRALAARTVTLAAPTALRAAAATTGGHGPRRDAFLELLELEIRIMHPSSGLDGSPRADRDENASATLRGRFISQSPCPPVARSLASPPALRCGHNSAWCLRVAVRNRRTRTGRLTRTGAETLQVVEPAQLSARYRYHRRSLTRPIALSPRRRGNPLPDGISNADPP